MVPSVSAHQDHGQASLRGPYPAAKQYAPTPVPDRLCLSWSSDPATTMDVCYRTDAGVTQTLCEWAIGRDLVGNASTGGIQDAARTQGINEPFVTNAGPCRMHTVRLQGLTPKTRYAYRVGDGVNWSPWNHFSTASDSAEPFEFLYFGDAQNAVRSLWARVRREAHNDAPRAAFALHAGDLINNANADGEWGEWHEAAGWLNATIPTVATPGNHEYALAIGRRKLSKHWRPSFSLPTNGPEGLEETCYWFDYQGTRIVSLNTNERLKEQAAWLDNTLTELPPARWTIVTFHHPVYSAAKDRDNPEVRALLKPLFDKHRIDMALQGHDHAYARSGLGGPEAAATVGTHNVAQGVRGQNGRTVYVVSVSGPKMYPLTETWDASRVASGTQLYQTIRIERDQLRYRAYEASGELYDAFTLQKSSPGEVLLKEEIPATPERRRNL
ncbi:purple acid phosphatase family protein [Botrimarina hoheduenensis]|uniref:purple acid phosphatase family protein n=1 Tax=Botrimarina hoheduenensis TaxID=2528000 RepID=UPI0018D43329|nr:metallophosphoesterase family protein [Botrimarina hoheduenensis]